MRICKKIEKNKQAECIAGLSPRAAGMFLVDFLIFVFFYRSLGLFRANSCLSGPCRTPGLHRSRRMNVPEAGIEPETSRTSSQNLQNDTPRVRTRDSSIVRWVIIQPSRIPMGIER
jgi:hypothetical protein